MSFATSGVAWLTGVSSIRDFSIVMKNSWGAAEKEQQYLNAPVDKDTEQFVQEIESALASIGKK